MATVEMEPERVVGDVENAVIVSRLQSAAASLLTATVTSGDERPQEGDVTKSALVTIAEACSQLAPSPPQLQSLGLFPCLVNLLSASTPEPLVLGALALLEAACAGSPENATQLGYARGHNALVSLVDGHGSEGVREAAANVVATVCENTAPGSFPMKARDILSLDEDKPLLLVFGGRDERRQRAEGRPGAGAGTGAPDQDYGANKGAPAAAAAETEEIVVRLQRVRDRIAGKSQFAVGYRLWLASVVLGRYLHTCEEGRALIAGKRVLELGSGLGVSGLVAGWHAAAVLLTDFNPTVVHALEANIAGNCAGRGGACPVSAHLLDWTRLPERQDPSVPSSGGGGGGATCCAEEPQRRPAERLLSGDFDVIIAADVVCQDSDSRMLARVVDRYLSAAGVAVFLLPRPEHRYGLAIFPDCMRAAGLECALADIPSRLLGEPTVLPEGGDLDQHDYEYLHTKYNMWMIRRSERGPD